MTSLCGNIPEPKTLKELLEFFSDIKNDPHTVSRLQTGLNNGEINEALKSQRVVSVASLVDYVDGFYTFLVMKRTQKNYNPRNFTNCSEDELLNTFHLYLQKLYYTLLFLSWNVDMPWDVGLEFWHSQSTGESTNALCQWLTGQNDSQLAALNVLPGGFTTDELQTRLGSHLLGPLTFVDHEMPQIMALLFLRSPWEPPSMGDKVAFLRAFCKQVGNNEFKKKFEEQVKRKSGVEVEDLKTKSQNVLDHLKRVFGEIQDNIGLDDSLTPINDKCYRNLLWKHLGEYIKLLVNIIPKLMVDMPMMITAMKTWTYSGTDTDKSKSRFYYGFKGGMKGKEEEIKDTIGRLTKSNAGSLQQLLDALQATKSTGISGAEAPSKSSTTGQAAGSVGRDAIPSNAVGQPSDDASQKRFATTTRSADDGSHGLAGAGKDASTSSNVLEGLRDSVAPEEGSSSTGRVVGGLLGAGAAVGVGGAAYAGNLFGFGDLVRGAISGGAQASVASLRG